MALLLGLNYVNRVFLYVMLTIYILDIVLQLFIFLFMW